MLLWSSMLKLYFYYYFFPFQALGAYFYAVNCSLLSDSAVLSRLLQGSVRAGSILQLDNFHCLPHLLQVSLGRWLSTLACALSENSHHSTTALQSESTKSQDPRTVTAASVLSTVKQDSCTFSPHPSRQQVLSPHRSSTTPHRSTSPGYSNIFPKSSNTMTNEGHATSRSVSRATTRMDWYQSAEVERTEHRGFGYGGGASSRYVEVDGSLLKVSPLFGCVLVGDGSTQPIPEHQKVRIV